MITVLGKLKDTKKYCQDGYNVLISAPDWTPEKNLEWLRTAWEHGDDFLIVSHSATGQFAKELQWLVRNLTPRAADTQKRGLGLRLRLGQRPSAKLSGRVEVLDI